MGTTYIIKNALDQAAYWHRDQKRKYPVEIPYMSHIAGVAAILSRHRFSPEIVVAGILHDTIEDCGISADELREKFGPNVTRWVVQCSEPDKSLSWEDRKRLYFEHFLDKDWQAQAVAIADKIDNFQSILACNEFYCDPWTTLKFGREKQIELFDKMGKLLTKIQVEGGERANQLYSIINEYFDVLENVIIMEPKESYG